MRKLLFLLFLSLLVAGCAHKYADADVEAAPVVSPPIRSEDDAIAYSLSLPGAKDCLAGNENCIPSGFAPGGLYSEYKDLPWTVEVKYIDGDIIWDTWDVQWTKGEACSGIICRASFHSDGFPANPNNMTCGWANCK
jgi:hypothetical protein